MKTNKVEEIYDQKEPNKKSSISKVNFAIGTKTLLFFLYFLKLKIGKFLKELR